MLKINLIFATDNNFLFGLNNDLPWKLPEDLHHFNRTTRDTFIKNTLVMGKNTCASLKGKLEFRYQVVISSTTDSSNIQSNADYYYNSFDDFINNYKCEGKIFVIGGKRLIEECLTKYRNVIDNVYYTRIKQNVNVGDGYPIYLDKDIVDFTKMPLINKYESDNAIYYHFKFNKHEEYQYLNLLNRCLTNGDYRETRNSRTYSYFGDKLTFDLSHSFPLITTKKVFMRGIFEELMFFIRGQTNSKILEDKGVNIWKPNTSKEFIEKCKLSYNEGDMGPLYGFNWNHFGAEYIDCHYDYTGQGFNQIEYVLELLQNDPHSRRIIMSDFNPAQACKGVLYPCHSIVIQFYINQVDDKYLVSMSMYQRSADAFLGECYNITSSSLLLYLVCNTLNARVGSDKYQPNKLHLFLGDIHVYNEHIDAVKEQLKRIPFDFPKLKINKQETCLKNYNWEDIEVVDYKCHPMIKASMIA